MATELSLIPIIGLEVHFELKTRTKMFCGCPAGHFRRQANTAICPVCLGLPGTLPVPNWRAIAMTVRIAQALGAKINSHFIFERKNYFYPDLPKGYQISQHRLPIGQGGAVPILLAGRQRLIKLHDIHLEEDTAKIIHQPGGAAIDFNRSGVPLVEVVSEPVIHSPAEAKEYVRRMRQLVRWLGISDGDMEKGSMRLEANISLAPKPKKGKMPKLPNYRVEIKNLNSFRFMEKALQYEIQRQTLLFQRGQKPDQETRGFDVNRGITFLQRRKEFAQDYRYFPEPDIPPFYLSSHFQQRQRQRLPRLPWQEEERLIKKGLSWQLAKTLVANETSLRFWHELEPWLNKKKLPWQKFANLVVNKPESWQGKSAAQFIESFKKAEENRISGKNLIRVVRQVIDEETKAVADYRRGKTNVIGFLIGRVQQKTAGKADPRQAQQLLQQILSQGEKE